MKINQERANLCNYAELSSYLSKCGKRAVLVTIQLSLGGLLKRQPDWQ